MYGATQRTTTRRNGANEINPILTHRTSSICVQGFLKLVLNVIGGSGQGYFTFRLLVQVQLADGQCPLDVTEICQIPDDL